MVRSCPNSNRRTAMMEGLLSSYVLGCESSCRRIGSQGDVNIPTFAAASESVIRCKEPIKSSIQFGSISNNIFENNVVMTRGTLPAKIPDINAQLNEPSEHDQTIKGNSSVIIHCLGESCDASKSPIQFGSLSNFVGHHSKKDENIIFTEMKKPVELMPKPRTALFQGGEDDEPMARQISSVGNSSSISNMEIGLKFGAILFDEKYGKNMEKFTSAGLSSNILFRGVNCHNKEEEKKKRKYIYIGAMQVNVDD